MSQFSLFDSPRVPEPPRPDLNFIRKTLNRALRQAREAEVMPWDEARTARWEREFPDLAARLPSEEGDELRKRFAMELARLRDHSAIANP